jgi:hypothetical protein
LAALKGVDVMAREISSTQQKRIIKQIRDQFGDSIDLAKSPAVLIEILRQFGRAFDDDGTGGVSPGTSTVAVGVDSGGTGTGGTGTGGTGSGGTGAGGTGTGGVSPGTSTVAVGITPPSSSQRVEIEEILKIVLSLRKDVAAVSKRLDRIASTK